MKQLFKIRSMVLSIAVVCCSGLLVSLHGQTVTTVAGSGDNGFADGAASSAAFSDLYGITLDGFGNIYVSANNRIRKITSDGIVSTVAGNGSTLGSNDGQGSLASFYHPRGIITDAAGNLYVADEVTYKIRKMTPSGYVSTLVTAVGDPMGIAIDASGNIYIADRGGNKIRKVTPAGVVTIIAGSGTPGSNDGVGTSASFYVPTGIVLDVSGNIYVTDYGNSKIRKITPAGLVSTFAGSGVASSIDGTGTSASFNGPSGIVFDAFGNIFVSDYKGNKIRKITPSGVVTTVAGTGAFGSTDGSTESASFNYPRDIAVDASGNIYIADNGNHKIRKITQLTTSVDNGREGMEQPIIFPNPAKETLYVGNDFFSSKYQLTDISGKELSNGILTSNGIDVNALVNGIYFIKIETKKGIVVNKFIKE